MSRPSSDLSTNDPGWLLSSRFTLQIRHWDDDYLIYHPGSGDTHLLDATRYLLLRQLGLEPCAGEIIAQRLAAELQLEPDASFITEIKTLLSDLYGLGLIEKRDAEARVTETLA